MGNPFLMALTRATTAAAPPPPGTHVFDALFALPPPTANGLARLFDVPPANALGSLFAPPVTSTAPIPARPQWSAVTERFKRFHNDLLLTPTQCEDGLTKARGVVRCLNAHCYGSNSESDHAFLIGSWRKATQTRPPRDVDLYFVLPADVHGRFEARRGNRQSDLLQEVKDVLALTYPSTDMRGDGQVVVVAFESYSVEVVPAFKLKNGGFLICNTNEGGRYTETHPHEEATHIDEVDAACERNLRPLIRMIKAWQAHCNVPIKSFHLELVAAEFLSQSPWRLKSWFYFDWLTRDFFDYLRHQHMVPVPGGTELAFLGNEWRSRAETAYQRAVRACDNERDNYVYLAGEEWQKLFGGQVPIAVP